MGWQGGCGCRCETASVSCSCPENAHFNSSLELTCDDGFAANDEKAACLADVPTSWCPLEVGIGPHCDCGEDVRQGGCGCSCETASISCSCPENAHFNSALELICDDGFAANDEKSACLWVTEGTCPLEVGIGPHCDCGEDAWQGGCGCSCETASISCFCPGNANFNNAFELVCDEGFEPNGAKTACHRRAMLRR